MAKLLLTQAIVDSLRCEPGKKHMEYCDLQVPALMVYVTSSPTYIPKYQVRGKKDTGTNQIVTLGTTRQMTLNSARKLALQLKQEWATKSKTVSALALVETKTEMTWDAFIKDHFAPHCTAHIRSAKKYDQLHRLYVSPRLGSLVLRLITRKDCQQLHVDMVEKMKLSPASADHAIKFMRRALNLAVQWDYLEKNPLKNFELFLVSNEIENYLDSTQREKLLGILRTDSNRMVCHILMLLLSTGARVNEALTATWKNISIENRVWKVEAAKSKNKKIRTIPLNDSALWVLQQLDTQGKSEYLFPSPVTGKPQLSITRPWYRIRKLAGVKIRIHDLRHGFASMLVSGGRSLYEVQQILGHSDPKVTMRYAHLSSKTLQDAANAGSVLVPRVEAKAA